MSSFSLVAGGVLVAIVVLGCERGELGAERGARSQALASRAIAAEPQRRARAARPLADSITYSAVAHGTVTAVRFGAGEVELLAGSQVLTIRAHPLQLAALQLGQAARLTCLLFGDVLWLSSEGTPEPGAAYSFEQHGSTTGPVTRIDKAAGALGIGSIVMSAHPQALVHIVPGSRVIARFAAIDGRLWLLGVESAQ